MARSLPVYLAMCILGLNLGIMLVNSIDTVWIDSIGMNRSLFGEKVTPYVQYNSLQDAQGQNVTFNNYQSMSNATQRLASYGPTTGVLDQFGFWSITKNSIVTVINFLYIGFFGLPDMMYKMGMDAIFVTPMFIIVGIIEIIGGYEIIRGSSL